ncbi:hypothetical protein DFH08DRAFT_977346 [Mycena albidolilacea]|uniref:Uncharacterized protein n=1 Tax=Mycena albidolilacea TaxID=1033008 RepID=A0AAD6Z1R5_9AGAR|nr:hypothetical protein DFH08DRAFT_977346 [Mycena albidolilacea]
MSFCPSIEEVDEGEEPRGAPPLQLSSYILLGANEPDLPIAFDSVDKPNLRRPPATETGLQPDLLFFPYNTSPIASQDPTITVNHGEYLDVSTAGVAPDRLTADTFLSENAPDSGSIAEPSVELAARARLPEDISLTPSATALGKRPLREYPTDTQAQTDIQFSYSVHCPIVPVHRSSSSSMQFRPDEALHWYNGHTPYNPTTRNVHTGNDPVLTYLPGYWATISPAPVAPLQLKLQDVPATEPGEGIKFITVYTLNKEYGFSRTQSVCAAVPDASIALMCTDIPKLVQLYRYFTAPALSDLAARHCLQTSTRLSSLISIIAEHQLKRLQTVKHNLASSSRFFEMVFGNSPHDDGPSVVSTYNLNRHFEFRSLHLQDIKFG